MTEEIKKFYDYLGLDYQVDLKKFREIKQQKLINLKEKNADKTEVAYFNSACDVVEKYIVKENSNKKGFFDLEIALGNILSLVFVLLAVGFAFFVIMFNLL